VLNKADLADPAVTRAWLDHYNTQPGVRAIALSAKKPGDAARILPLCQTLAPHRSDNVKPLRMMIMGIPNVGKSTLINALIKRRLAKVGDEPAVTKAQQRYDLGPRQTLIDTPGLMWPKIEYDHDGYLLAASHAIGRNAVLEEAVATVLGAVLRDCYPDLLGARYGFDPRSLDGAGVLEAVARRRGCLRKGHAGELDLERAALLLLQDYRDGALGRVSLETPQSRAAMLAATEAQAALTAADSAATDVP